MEVKLIAKVMKGSGEYMTEKRLFGIVKGHREHIVDHTGRLYSDNEVANLLNELAEENEQLKQFKENVIKWVDSQMKFNAKKYIETEDSHFKSENIDLHNFKVFIGIDSND